MMYTPEKEQLTARQKLDNLTDALVDDIMAASDEEILAEAKEDGIDLDAMEKQFNEMVEKARRRSRAVLR